ncbi:MAG TPA: sulfur carrier protein ThiS [Nocardioidaceae bacterium]|nr:sulfur carrier protein ThiS [Nocardioidaceae bacterium]
MTIRVNGQEHAVAPDQNIDDLLASLDLPRRDVAVALDGAVVPRSHWQVTRVPDGAAVEVVAAMQGG